MKTPCLNCADRQIGCHGKCKKYDLYKEELEREKELKQTSLRSFTECDKFRKEMIRKTKRK